MKLKKIEIDVEVLSYEELNAEDKALVDASKEATSRSYAPYSNFHVGAALRLANGEVIQGNNQENAAYPSGLCAERVTMFYANSRYPDVAPLSLAIAIRGSNGEFLDEPGTPCGSCRQVLLESEERYHQNISILLYGAKYIYKLKCVRDLMPLSFDSDSLK